MLNFLIALNKICKVIDSCKTRQHVECAARMVDLFAMQFPQATRAIHRLNCEIEYLRGYYAK